MGLMTMMILILLLLILKLIIMTHAQLLDHMEPLMSTGGKVVDFHSCDLFPERWFQLVVVLRADTNVLYGRLEKRYVRVCGCS